MSTSAPATPTGQGGGGFAGGNANQTFHIALLINGKTVANGEFKGVPFGGGALGGRGPRQGNNNPAAPARGAGANAPNGAGSGPLSIGSNRGTPVSDDYAAPNPFNGEVDAVTFAITSPEEDTETN